ncbi:hypothetical protein LCGC14_0412430 [marine sediment metagenome]|uniref:Uncharacterized protein n=1 Tax=marine sediment metagenome TaxID=412755 RepID=A0A0F9TBH7_9ZZZZ
MPKGIKGSGKKAPQKAENTVPTKAEPVTQPEPTVWKPPAGTSESGRAIDGLRLEYEEKIAALAQENAKLRSFVDGVHGHISNAPSAARAMVDIDYDNWPDVDKGKPRVAIKKTMKTTDGQVVPLEGKIKVSVLDGMGKVLRTIPLTFVNGRCVTNDIKAAQSLALQGGGIGLRML